MFISERQERRDRFDQGGLVLDNVAYADTDQENLLNTICDKCGNSFPMLMIFMHKSQCRGAAEQTDDRPELGELKRSATATADEMREIRCVKCG